VNGGGGNIVSDGGLHRSILVTAVLELVAPVGLLAAFNCLYY
jgi:hypothetical protein